MVNKPAIGAALVCLLLVPLGLGCHVFCGLDRIVATTGMVQFVDLEGGFYGIVGDDGQKYDPLNLNDEFRVDGMRVSFIARLREDVATTRMWGTPIEILHIEGVQ